MSDDSPKQDPTPEELHKKMQEMFKQGFPGGSPFMFPMQGVGQQSPQAVEPEDVEEEPFDFSFDYKPREVKEHLDRFVIKQDEAKKVLSVALCDHYHHVRLALEGKDQPNYAKQNILLVGPTGVGKTYLIRSIADLIGVPFVKADATKFSETGYVGGDAEDLVRDLLRQADGDVQRAEYGIIYIDEIDKIAAAGNQGGRDVSGRGVQTNLLKLMEETDVPARAPNDLSGQIQAMMEMQGGGGGGKKQPETISTKHILFVVSGAFDGLEKITSKRVRESSIGFAATEETPSEAEELFQLAATRDFIEYGFEPEFIGRLPVRVTCNSLTKDDLFEILKTSEGSIIRQYEQTLSAYGIDVLFEDDGLRRIAELAVEEKTGARGLMTVAEGVFRDLKFELPSTEVKSFVVDEALVNDPRAALERLLEEHKRHESAVMRQLVHEFGRRFQESHNLNLTFTEEAADMLIAQAQEQAIPVRDLCAARFKDFQFGLKLISQNTGENNFVVDQNIAADPETVLSEMVVKSYKSGDSKAAKD